LVFYGFMLSYDLNFSYNQIKGSTFTSVLIVVQNDFNLTLFCPIYQNLCVFSRKIPILQTDVLPTEEQILGQGGSVQMAMGFDRQLSLLTVRLLQASNLVSKGTDLAPSAYFKISLVAPPQLSEPPCSSKGGAAAGGAKQHAQTYQSKTYPNQRSPDLNDEFYFEVS